MKQSMIMTIVLVVVVAGGAFFAGTKYQQSRRGGLTGANGQRQFQGNRQGFRPVNGQIISTDNNSITVKLQDGSSKIVIISDKTVINQAASATKDDLKTGETVAVFGQDNSDGSVTAQNIQLNPILRGGNGGQ